MLLIGVLGAVPDGMRPALRAAAPRVNLSPEAARRGNLVRQPYGLRRRGRLARRRVQLLSGQEFSHGQDLTPEIT